MPQAARQCLALSQRLCVCSPSPGVARCTGSAPQLTMMGCCGVPHRLTGRESMFLRSGGTVETPVQGVALWRGTAVSSPSPTRAPPTQSAPHRIIMVHCGVHWTQTQGGTGGVTSTPGGTVRQGAQVFLMKTRGSFL